MTWAIENKGYLQRRACDLVGIASRVYRYRSSRPNDAGLCKGLREQPCALRNRRRRRSLSSISLSRSAIAASRSAMALDANARSASIVNQAHLWRWQIACDVLCLLRGPTG